MADTDCDAGDTKGREAFLRERVKRLEKENAAQAKLLEQFRAMVENSTDVMMRYDANLRHIYVSPSVEATFGRKPEEFIGKTHLEAGFSPAISQYRENRIRRVFETGKSLESEYEAASPRGLIIVNWRLFLERDASGEARSVLSVCRDITSHRRAERNFAALFESLPEGFALFEAQGPASAAGEKATGCRLLEANKVFCSMFGLRRADIRKKLACEALDGRLLDAVKKAQEMARLAKTGKFSLHEPELDRRLEINVHVPAKGQFAILVMDMTDREEFGRRLTTAKDAAECASRAKSEFLANMSHELRTPMNGALGMLQLLQSTPLTDEQAEYVGIAMDSGKCLLRIIEDILDLAKIEAEKVGLNEEETDVREIMRLTRDVFSPQAASRGVSLRVALGEETPAICYGDGYRLKQILFNLAGNAVKFTQSGEVLIQGDALEVPGDPKALRFLFSVSDTGVGIPGRKMRSIFEPFTQADGSITRKFQGLGLGLGIAKRLIELMGGTMYMESVPGEGTLVAFTVLFSRAPAQGEKAAPALKPPAAVKPAPAKVGLRVLVAEDDLTNRLAMESALRKLGHEAVCAANGREVLELLSRDGDFDVALMDLQMPVMNGLDAAREIRRLEPPLCSLPLVAVTAHVMTGDKERALSAGMDGYLAKPVHFKELGAALERFRTKPAAPWK